ncbi:MAG: DUF4156 domain-containing protein [Tahibacter sp.]
MKRLVPILLVATALNACTWVKLDDAGQRVRVAYNGGVSACQHVGDISVSVKDRVGPYQRNAIKVRDELESLARNQAVELQADTITPLAEPKDGEQRYSALRCGGAPSTAAAKPDASKGDVQTYPVR